jgi:hypothetical protein
MIGLLFSCKLIVIIIYLLFYFTPFVPAVSETISCIHTRGIKHILKIASLYLSNYCKIHHSSITSNIILACDLKHHNTLGNTTGYSHKPRIHSGLLPSHSCGDVDGVRGVDDATGGRSDGFSSPVFTKGEVFLCLCFCGFSVWPPPHELTKTRAYLGGFRSIRRGTPNIEWDWRLEAP